MPTNRSKRTRGRRQAPVNPLQWALLNDQDPPADCNQFELLEYEFPISRHGEPHPLLEPWQRCKEMILARWIMKWPGTRPSFWWRFEMELDEAPEDQTGFLMEHNILTVAEKRRI